jgi:hypothetical protein
MEKLPIMIGDENKVINAINFDFALLTLFLSFLLSIPIYSAQPQRKFIK